MTSRQFLSGEEVTITNTPDYSSTKVLVLGLNAKQNKEFGRQIRISNGTGSILMSMEAFEEIYSWLKVAPEPKTIEPLSDELVRDCIEKGNDYVRRQASYLNRPAKIEAIKILRERAGLVLKEAKEHVEVILSRMPVETKKFRTRTFTADSGLAYSISLNVSDISAAVNWVLLDSCYTKKQTYDEKVVEIEYNDHMEFAGVIESLRGEGFCHESDT